MSSGAAVAIGWVGTGVMGKAMARRLMAAGHALSVTTRNPEKARELVADGAHWVDHPRHLLSRASVIITMLGYPRDVEDVYLGAEGLLAGDAAPKQPLRLMIDMTTSSPALATRIASAAKERACMALDAPVSGGDVGAREGTLSIMVGGDESAFEEARPIFEKLGRKIVRAGGPGTGQHTKMVNQILIAANMVGVCEGLLYAERAGLDLDRALESVGAGAAASWSLANLAPRIRRGDFEPGFFVDHFVKDMGIALEEASRMGLAVPGLALAKQLYEAVRAQGLGRKGTQALYLALRRMNERETGA